MIKMTEDGYVFISKNGIQYDLLEGLTFGQKQRYTSDIIFVLLGSPDYNAEDNFVGYLYGAMFFENDLEEYEKSIGRMVDEFEEKNFGKK